MFGKLLDKAAHQLEKAKLAVKEGYIKGDKRENARNNAMVSEMKAFKDHVIKIRQEISDCGAKAQAMMYTMGSVFSLPLPVAYINSPETPNGAAPADNAQHLVGEAVNVHAIMPAVQTMQAKLQDQVLKPLDSWLNSFSATKEKNHKCEALKLDLDAQRKSVSAAEESVKSGKNPGNAQAKLEGEKQKEAALEAQFQSMEAEIYNEMLVSIQFILDLRKYCILAVQVMQEALQAVSSTFDLQTPAIAMNLPPPAPLTAGGAANKPPDSSQQGGVVPATSQPTSTGGNSGSPTPPPQFAPVPLPGGYYPPPASYPAAGPSPAGSSLPPAGGYYYPPAAALGDHEAAAATAPGTQQQQQQQGAPGFAPPPHVSSGSEHVSNESSVPPPPSSYADVYEPRS
jgi:hypothetical protein